MSIDISAILKLEEAKLIEIAVADVPVIMNLLTDFLTRTETRLISLEQEYLADQDGGYLKLSLDNEFKILENELLTIVVAGEQLAQDEVNQIVQHVKDFVNNQIEIP